MTADCANPACGCAAATPGGACSAYCANVSQHEDGEDAACSCGHAACVDAQRIASHRESDEVHTAVGSAPRPAPTDAQPDAGADRDPDARDAGFERRRR